ncbi:hNH endonuclease [Citrobacter farmeri]
MKPSYEELQEQLETAQRELRSADITMQNLEAKCEKLAAENAGLKAICEDRRTFIMNGVQLGYIQVPTVETDPALETIRVAVSPQEQTPATDAFLAEVRAQAQSEVIEWLDAEITAIDTMYRGDPSYEHDAYWMKSEVLDAVELARKAFAAQLRKEHGL